MKEITRMVSKRINEYRQDVDNLFAEHAEAVNRYRSIYRDDVAEQSVVNSRKELARKIDGKRAALKNYIVSDVVPEITKAATAWKSKPLSKSFEECIKPFSAYGVPMAKEDVNNVVAFCSDDLSYSDFRVLQTIAAKSEINIRSGRMSAYAGVLGALNAIVNADLNYAPAAHIAEAEKVYQVDSMSIAAADLVLASFRTVGDVITNDEVTPILFGDDCLTDVNPESDPAYTEKYAIGLARLEADASAALNAFIVPPANI